MYDSVDHVGLKLIPAFSNLVSENLNTSTLTRMVNGINVKIISQFLDCLDWINFNCLVEKKRIGFTVSSGKEEEFNKYYDHLVWIGVNQLKFDLNRYELLNNDLAKDSPHFPEELEQLIPGNEDYIMEQLSKRLNNKALDVLQTRDLSRIKPEHKEIIEAEIDLRKNIEVSIATTRTNFPLIIIAPEPLSYFELVVYEDYRRKCEDLPQLKYAGAVRKVFDNPKKNLEMAYNSFVSNKRTPTKKELKNILNHLQALNKDISIQKAIQNDLCRIVFN